MLVDRTPIPVSIFGTVKTQDAIHRHIRSVIEHAVISRATADVMTAQGAEVPAHLIQTQYKLLLAQYNMGIGVLDYAARRGDLDAVAYGAFRKELSATLADKTVQKVGV